ncbi:3-dehydroquinate synthase [Inhella proteolytica]|uniref:3-dehydroquinate synthase n=1 Tax=Inhella proteolytica TaxID=2795029 RepID=A0A931J0A8_9BURK|nr:3-dehydroquinate synthase [Inhella proteolytica]
MSSRAPFALEIQAFEAGSPPPHALSIDLGDRSYPIHIGQLDWLGCLAEAQLGGRLAVVISNPVVAPLYSSRLISALRTRFAAVELHVAPDGEVAKEWSSLQAILGKLADLGADRDVVLFALGGGVIGDLTGFAAAIYMRGVCFVQVPTTLLAQVDSSVGGKTGINLPQGKNLVGAFHQPQAVWADLDVLGTLPAREYSAGLAEVIKYGPVADPAFFAWLERNMDALMARDHTALMTAVRRACEIKAAVVAADEREGGVRAILNFGHTFGHALEAGLGYGALLHGEAVALGMLMATELSVRALGLDSQLLQRLKSLLERAQLPVRAPYLDPERFLQLMRGDKKAAAGSIRYVLIPVLGQACLQVAPDALALEAIASHSASVTK